MACVESPCLRTGGLRQAAEQTAGYPFLTGLRSAAYCKVRHHGIHIRDKRGAGEACGPVEPGAAEPIDVRQCASTDCNNGGTLQKAEREPLPSSGWHHYAP